MVGGNLIQTASTAEDSVWIEIIEWINIWIVAIVWMQPLPVCGVQCYSGRNVT